MPEDEATGRILGEIGGLRRDFKTAIDRQDQRLLEIERELEEVKQIAGRAVNTAAEAKKVADQSATETAATHRAVMQHTAGIGESLSRQDKELAGLRTQVNAVETKVTTVESKVTDIGSKFSAQTTALESLVKAESERATAVQALVKAESERATAVQALVKAEEERVIHQKAIEEVDNKRWTRVQRWWPIILAGSAAIATVIGWVARNW